MFVQLTQSVCQSLRHVRLFATPWTVACQALLSMELSRQEYWSGLSCYSHQILKGLPRYFPGGSESKESTCDEGDLGSIPGLGRSPGAGNGNPLHYSPWGLKQSDTTERLHFATTFLWVLRACQFVCLNSHSSNINFPYLDVNYRGKYLPHKAKFKI